MHRTVAVLLVGFALVLVVRSDESLRCYMCTSVTNLGCDTDPKAHNIEPTECTLDRMDEWQRIVQQHPILNKIANIFVVDNSQHYQVASPMACAKMVLKVANQDITVRTCQTEKTDTIDPCKAIKGMYDNLEVCELCSEDSCNGSTTLSPTIFFMLLSALGVIALGAFHNTA